MKTMLRYLLRTRGGIGTTLLCAGGILIISFWIIGLFTGMNIWIYRYIEKLTLLAAVIGFPFICGNAFRFGTANGVSRRTLIQTLLASVFVTAASLSAVNALQLIIRNRVSMDDYAYYGYYHWSYDLYCMNLVLPAERDDLRSEDAETLLANIPKLICWESLLYFGMLCLLLTACCCLYALFRKYGVFGLLGGTLIPLALVSVFRLKVSVSAALMQKLRDIYYHKEPAQLSQFFLSYPPKALPFFLSFAAAILTVTAVFVLVMRRTGIRKECG
ncbi:MAG: hypothetical protein IK134_08355 [Oscillospiraceae bacterium]|nr:hypothetical protein [Oscillospiraceae bacterium]